MCGNSDTVDKNVTMGLSCTSENTEGEDLNGGERDCSFKGRRVTHTKLNNSLLGAKAEKTKHRQEKLAKVKSKIQVERRQQPQREAALTAAAAAAARASEDEFSYSDSEGFTSDSDCSDGSRASYDYEKDLRAWTYLTDTDFMEGLSGVDKQEFNEKHKAKKRFLAQPRDTTIPILQRCQTNDRYSQKCQIIREEEGCSGSSRGLSNIVIPIENAAIDQYSEEFNNIIEGTDVNHEYHSLSTQIGYHQLHSAIF